MLEDLGLDTPVVYWPPGAADQFGRTKPGPKVQKYCRWEDRQQLIRILTGEEKLSRARVFFRDEVVVGSWLWLGELVAAPADPPQQNKVMHVHKVDDVEQTETLWTAFL